MESVYSIQGRPKKATLPSETLMSKKAINDKLQGSVVTYLRCGGVVNNQIKKGLGLYSLV